MKKIVDKLAHKIAENQNLDKDHEEVIAYGMLAFSQMVIILLLAIICGIIISAVFECISIFLCVGIFRKFTGGAHGSSMGQCILVSVSSIFLMAALSKFVLAQFVPFYIAPFIIGAVFIFSYIVVFLKAPVDSPNKPITNLKKIKRLRISANIFITAILLLVGILMIISKNSYNYLLTSLEYSLTLAILWQSATLTPLFTFFKH